MVVLERLCLESGSHSMSHLLPVRSTDVDTMPSWSMTSSNWGTRIASEHLLASKLSHYRKEGSYFPLCSQLLAEEKQYFPSGQRHFRFSKFYYLPWILSSVWRSITSFVCSNLSYLQDCNLGQLSRVPNPFWRGCFLRAQSLVHFRKEKEPSGRFTDKSGYALTNHGIC